MGFKLGRVVSGQAGSLDRMTGNNGRNLLFGDKDGQAADAARMAELFRAQSERARSDLMGVLAQRPEYQSAVTGPEFDQLKNYAFGAESSPGFMLQRQREGQNLTDALGAGAQAEAGTNANAYSNLAMGGGLSGGARERIAGGSAVQSLLGRQAARGQSAKNLTDLGISEEGQRFQTRGSVSDALMQDKIRANSATQDAWKTKAQTIAGLNQAEGQQAAALATRATDKGMCCFIFLEARYGNGTMDSVVRRYRDEYMTDRNRRGYYKVAEILVPLMRVITPIKWLVRLTMTDPLVSYGKWHYEKRGIGFIFKPIKDFWMSAFNFFGGETKFIRENGETV